MEAVRAAEEYVKETRGDGARWLETPEAQLVDTLSGLGLQAGAIDEVLMHYGSLQSHPLFGPLVGGMVERLVRDREHLDEPIPIWPDFDEWGDVGRLWWIYVFALATPSLIECHRRRGLPEPTIRRTLSALQRHVDIHYRKWGTLGVDAGWWMIPLLRGELVHVGSLQFHRLHLGVSTLAPDPWFSEEESFTLGPGFRRGDEAWGIHIPDGADLTRGALDATFEEARETLSRAWPARTRRVATLQSWMMDPRLASLVGGDSRIVNFQRRFHLTARWGEDVDNVVEFVFREPASHLRGLVARTRVQAAVLQVLRSGDAWRDGVGWMDFDAPSVH